FDRVTHGPTGEHTLNDLSRLDNERPTDDDVLDAARGLHRFFVGPIVNDRGRIEDSQVRVCADTNTPLVLHRGDESLQSLGWHQCHLSQTIHEAEKAALSDVATEDS